MSRFLDAARRATCLVGLLGVLFAGPGRAEEPFDYFANSFSVIGLKDYLHGTRVTQYNTLSLEGKSSVRLLRGPQLPPSALSR